MNWATAQSKLKRILRQRNFFLRLVSYQMGIIALLILTLVYAFTSQRTIISPPVVTRSFWVDRTDVSESYLADMTNFFVGIRLNISPANAENQREVLLRYTDSRYYTAFKAVLVDEAEQIKKQNLTMAFYPVDIQVNTKKLTAKVSGDLVSSVGQSVLPAKRLTYIVSYRYQNGALLLNRFEEFKENAT